MSDEGGESMGKDSGKGNIGMIIGIVALVIGALIAADAFGIIEFGSN